jgi:hypothetical protein
MKDIAIEINETTQTHGVDENGEFGYYIYASNQCNQEFEQAIETLALIWELPTDVSLAINLTLRGVYRDTIQTHHISTRGKNVIEARSAALFVAMRKDCQWIIDQIDALEVK